MWGYGNPGKEYENTRHNVGFMAIDCLAKKLSVEVSKEKFSALCGEGVYNGEKLILLKPQTFMNLSGKSVEEAVSFYKISLDDLIVIYDDIDIEFGKIRIRPEGSSGTHNGMRNISDTLNSHDFPRIRIGVGKPEPDIDLAEYVLSNFNLDEMKIVSSAVEIATESVLNILDFGIQKAMNMVKN